MDDAELIARVRYCRDYGIFEAAKIGKAVSYTEIHERLETLAAEVERLREALSAYTEYCNICHGRGAIIEEDIVTGDELWTDCPGCGEARAALEQGEQ
jgi:mono/diheme cytochrome c family protein